MTVVDVSKDLESRWGVIAGILRHFPGLFTSTFCVDPVVTRAHRTTEAKNARQHQQLIGLAAKVQNQQTKSAASPTTTTKLEKENEELREKIEKLQQAQALDLKALYGSPGSAWLDAGPKKKGGGGGKQQGRQQQPQHGGKQGTKGGKKGGGKGGDKGGKGDGRKK